MRKGFSIPPTTRSGTAWQKPQPRYEVTAELSDGDILPTTPIYSSMSDFLTPEERSLRMSQVKNKNTKPEIRVRRLLHGMGYRYRLHGADLPGRPDIVFSSRKKVIFIHGCFWHGHSCRKRSIDTLTPFWRDKIRTNQERDTQATRRLEDLGWKHVTIWECETKKITMPSLQSRLSAFLGDTSISKHRHK